MSPSPGQTRQAAMNTRQRNHAPVIYTVIKNNKPAEAGLVCPVEGHHKQEAYCGCSQKAKNHDP